MCVQIVLGVAAGSGTVPGLRGPSSDRLSPHAPSPVRSTPGLYGSLLRTERSRHVENAMEKDCARVHVSVVPFSHAEHEHTCVRVLVTW
jgi:hypothetical protein